MKKLIDYLKIGDKVFDILEGWGYVRSLTYKTEDNDDRPIYVEFLDELFTHRTCYAYTADGKEDITNKNPSLFLHEVKLEQNLPEFVEGELVLVCGYECNGWKVAKYQTKSYNHAQQAEYSVFLSQNFEGFEEEPRLVKYCKSFNDPHFVK